MEVGRSQRKNNNPEHLTAALCPQNQRIHSVLVLPFGGQTLAPGKTTSQLEVIARILAATPTAGRVGSVQKRGHPDTRAPHAWGFNPSGPTCHLTLLALFSVSLGKPRDSRWLCGWVASDLVAPLDQGTTMYARRSSLNPQIPERGKSHWRPLPLGNFPGLSRGEVGSDAFSAP